MEFAWRISTWGNRAAWPSETCLNPTMVDYPILIDSGDVRLEAGRPSGRFPNHVGPSFDGTNIYVFLYDIVTAFTDAHVEMWKSTDQGEAWTQLDSANDPDTDTTPTSVGMVIDAQETFDLGVIPELYACYQAPTTGALIVHPFNITTEKWGTASSPGPVPENSRNMAFARRPAGINQIEFPIAYDGPVDTVAATDYLRVYYTVYRLATDSWDTEVRLFGGVAEAERYRVESRAEGPSTGVGQGRVHFFAESGQPGQSDLFHKSVESDDVINVIETVRTNGFVARTTGFALSGSEIVVPYVESGDDLMVSRAISSSSMVWAALLRQRSGRAPA